MGGKRPDVELWVLTEMGAWRRGSSGFLCFMNIYIYIMNV